MSEVLYQNGRDTGIRIVDISDDYDGPASFVCPNCDDDITEDEHEAFGICTACVHPH